MSISITESRDTLRAYDAMNLTAERRERAERTLTRMFLNEAFAGDMAASSELVTRNCFVAGAMAKRPATVGEVLADSLDYGNGPSLDDVLSILVRAAKTDTEARALLDRMACKWAEMQVLE